MLTGLRVRHRSVTVSAIEPVAEAAHAGDVARVRRIRLDLPAQVQDLVVHDAVGDGDVAAPGGVQQLLRG